MPFSLDEITEEAFYSIFDGSALLFLGAGFDYGNTNINGTDIPIADGLADKFMEAISETRSPGEDLKKCSGHYEYKMGRQRLLSELNGHVSIPAPESFQKDIIRCPWQRIYTTNYNNVIFDCQSSPRKIRKIGLKDGIPRYESERTDCLYVNGYVEIVPEDSSIIITNKDYEQANPSRESIITTFRTDVAAARFVFFLGYSMYDIDIARIMQNDTSVKDKVYIVSGEKIRTIDEERLSEFGTVIAANCSQLPPILSKYRDSFSSLPVKRKDSFYSLKKVTPDALPATSPRGSDLQALLYRGEINRGFLKGDMVKNSSSYMIVRSVAEKIKKHFDSGIKAAILYSKICNGKTIAANQIASYLSEFYDIFIANTESSVLLSDIIKISSSSSSQKIIIFDGYASSFFTIRDTLPKISNVQYLFTERTALFRNIEENTLLVFGGNIASFSLDSLDSNELQSSFDLLSTHGLIENEYNRFFDTASSNGLELGKILLDLFDSPEISNRFRDEFTKIISENSGYEQEIYATIMLSIVCGNAINKSTLNNLLDKNTAYTNSFSRCSAFREILVNNSDTVECARVLALFLAKKAFNPDKAIEVAIKITRSLRMKNSVDQYKNISRQFLRYSILEKILPEVNFLDCSLRFYEELKFVGGLKDEPLFWLQFGIACLRKKEFSLAKSHFDRARKVAGPSFDMYQIDNQYARLLFETDTTIDGLDAFERFLEAECIIRAQLRTQPDSIYPFRSAKSIFNFKVFFENFDLWQLSKINKFIEFILLRFEKLQDRIKLELKHDIVLIRNTNDIITKLTTS